VRKAVLNVISISKYTLPEVINRTRDGEAEVRKQAYLIIAKKVPLEKISLEHRIQLLENGLQDR
jgi:hypothetical protein